ncbi:hypothetical protein [Pontimicrobium sp. MEBiC01747]
MKILSQITPAQTKLIIDNNSVALKNLMKLTFMDLVLKKVLKIKEVEQKAHSRDKHTRAYTYIIPGKNFNSYKPKVFESVFLSPFYKSPEIQIQFKTYIKLIYDNSKGRWNYKKTVKNTSEIKPYFKSTFFINLFKQIKLTPEGHKLNTALKDYLYKIDSEIINLLENNKKKALELLENIGGNIFLLKNLDFEMLKKLDKELSNQQKHYNSDAYDYNDNDDGFWLFFGAFDDNYMYDSYFNDFDSTIDSYDSDSSGCASFDSGCSSCSGCGGCGGCS